MPKNHDETFEQQRRETLDRVIALIEARLQAGGDSPIVLSRYNEISPASLRQGAEKEVWSLFLRGIRHLKEGAPGGQAGAMTEALSRMSLRASSFAAALQIKPPQFEQLVFSVEYANGHEAALFFCRRLVEAAEGDIFKSQQVIRQKMQTEKPGEAGGEEAVMKRQMALTFNALAETYIRLCGELRETLRHIPPPARPQPPGQSFNL